MILVLILSNSFTDILHRLTEKIFDVWNLMALVQNTCASFVYFSY